MSFGLHKIRIDSSIFNDSETHSDPCGPVQFNGDKAEAFVSPWKDLQFHLSISFVRCKSEFITENTIGGSKGLNSGQVPD